MVGNDIQYFTDSLLIDKLYSLDSALSKRAGIVDDLMGGVGSAISSFTQNNVDTSSPSGTASSVFKILEAATLFRIHPMLGIIDVAAQEALGLSLTDAISKVISIISSKLSSGQQISEDELRSATASAVGGVTSTAFFKDIHEIEKRGELIKSAQFFQSSVNPNQQPLGGAFFGTSKGGILKNIFGFLGQQKGKSLLGGFVFWIIKTVLLGSGLLIGAKAIHQAISPKDEAKPETNVPVPLLKSSGKGQEFHQNDNKQDWYVPLVNKNVADTVLYWATQIYPELTGYDDIVLRAPAFKNAITPLMAGFTQGEDYLWMPKEYHRLVDVVDKFAQEVNKEIHRVTK